MFGTILFTHHNIEMRNIFYEAFTDLGYKVTTTPTHKDVLEILKKDRPDYIILDPQISDISYEILAAKIKIIDEDIKVIISNAEENKPQAIIGDIVKIIKKHVASFNQKENNAIQLKTNILVVDDEKECVQLLKNYLCKKGFQVNTATSGEEAILKINAHRPDIVLLDIYMSGIDGLLVLKKIKNIDKSIIVIMTTAVGDEKIIKEALKLGADSYLTKPFNLSQLERAIFLTNTLHTHPHQ